MNDHSAAYPYNFYYQKSRRLKSKDKSELTDNAARISLDNKCNIQVVFDGKHYDLTYTSIETADVDNKEAILITIDTQNRIWLYDGTARVECKKLGKKMLFVGANGKDYRAIMEQLRIGTFRM